MRSVIQTNPSYELSIDITQTNHGHSLKFISFVRTARRPEDQVQYQALMSTTELKALGDLIREALPERGHEPSGAHSLTQADRA